MEVRKYGEHNVEENWKKNKLKDSTLRTLNLATKLRSSVKLVLMPNSVILRESHRILAKDRIKGWKKMLKRWAKLDLIVKPNFKP